MEQMLLYIHIYNVRLLSAPLRKFCILIYLLSNQKSAKFLLVQLSAPKVTHSVGTLLKSPRDI